MAVLSPIKSLSGKGKARMRMKRLQPCKLLFAALIAGIGCTIFMISSLAGMLQETGIQPMDLYWLYFGVIPRDWEIPFNVLKYAFTLIPLTLISYFVSNDIQTNLIETKYTVVIRYQSIRRWISSGCQTALAVTVFFLLIFHISFLAMNYMICAKYIDSVPSNFSAGQTGSVLVLIVKQMFFVSALSIVQIIVALRHNIQTGLLVELCIGGTIIFLDLLQILTTKLFCADAGMASFIVDGIIFVLALAWILLLSSSKNYEKYLG